MRLTFTVSSIMHALSISVIIPTYNESGYLAQTIAHLKSQTSDYQQIEIIVVDVSEDEETAASVAQEELRLFRKKEFRGRKYASLNFGASKAQGDFLLFLDADTLLPERFDELINEIFARKETVGGAFEFSFQEPAFGLLIIKWLNRLRYRMDGCYFGDQAVFCRRDTFQKVGGYPKEALMESAFFCRKLRKEGRLKLIKATIKTSGRRFLENGIASVFFFDLRVWIKFLLGRRLQKESKRYWPIAE